MTAPMSIAVRCAALLACVAPCLHAAPHRLRIHKNASLEILAIVENKDGLLWLGTTDGVYEFTGLRFRKVEGYPFRAAEVMATTPDGALWIGSSEGLVRYRSQFEVLIRQQVLGLTKVPKGIFVKLSRRDNLLFRADGSNERIQLYAQKDIIPDSSGTLWFICSMPNHACSVDPERFQPGERVLADGDYFQAARDREGRVWAAAADRASAFHRGRIVESLNRSIHYRPMLASPLLAGRDGQLWFLGDAIQGISPFVEFSGSRQLREFGVTAGLEDSRGHLWAAVPGHGLIEWIEDPTWERWAVDDLNGERAQQVFTTERGEFIAVTHAHLYRLDPTSRRWRRLPDSRHPYIAVSPLPHGGFLASIRGIGLARLSESGRIIQSWLAPMDTDDYRAIVPDAAGRWWVGHGQGLLEFDPNGGQLPIRKVDLPGGTRSPGVHVLPGMPGDRVWVGYRDGLAYSEANGAWSQLRTGRALPFVISAAPSENGDLWVVYLGADRSLGAGGWLARLRRAGEQWRVEDFPAAESGPAMSRFVRRDSRGWIWRGTTDGIYVSDGRATGTHDWLHINLDNGLAAALANQHGFFEDASGDVWICGDGGITRMTPRDGWFKGESTSPVIRQTTGSKNVTTFDIASLNTPPFRSSPVKYRILPQSPDWKLSREGIVEVPDSSGKSYTIEAAFTANGPAMVSRYTVHPAEPEARRWWGWLAGFIAVLIGALLFWTRRSEAYERTRYRISKWIYVVRSRLHGGARGSAVDVKAGCTDFLTDRYELVGTVARSGFSIVYEARDRHDSGAAVAIKVLNRLSGQAGWIRQRFAQEVAALASIDHPGVVPIRDSWTGPNGELCIAMPYLSGPTLRAELVAGTMNPERAAMLARKIGRALEVVHRRGIVHRDLKPENIILIDPGTADEQPVLIDFGAAGIRGGVDELASTTLLAGSLRYLAPERLAGYYCPATDTYALGVIVLEMLTGRCLADLGVLVSDPAFVPTLTTALKAVAGEAAPEIASCLIPAFEPLPQRRPADPASWADLLADVLVAHART